jgi:hypothetical protein
MPLMPAFKIRNPIGGFIKVEANNFTRDCGDICSHGFHIEASSYSTLFIS